MPKEPSLPLRERRLFFCLFRGRLPQTRKDAMAPGAVNPFEKRRHSFSGIVLCLGPGGIPLHIPEALVFQASEIQFMALRTDGAAPGSPSAIAAGRTLAMRFSKEASLPAAMAEAISRLASLRPLRAILPC